MSRSPSVSSSDSARPSPSPSPYSRPTERKSNTPRSNSRSIFNGEGPRAGVGGCWTCRLRRKKCDEQRQGDSCQTCTRLTIDCLGWGPKRPAWMRDKEAVATYKANIKEHLTRAGLIRGQPQGPLLLADSIAARTAKRQAHPQHRSLGRSLSSDRDRPFFSETLSSHVGTLETSSFNLDPHPVGTNLHRSHSASSYFRQSSHSSLAPFTINNDLLDFDFSNIVNFDFDVQLPSPIQQAATPPPVDVWISRYLMGKSQNDAAILAGTIVSQNTAGVLVAAIGALANLQYGDHVPSVGPRDYSSAKKLRDNAFMQLSNSKSVRGCFTESEALAALYLVWFSLKLGETDDWRLPLDMILEWIRQTGLPEDENAKSTLVSMSSTAQLVLKYGMHLDIISSITLAAAPRFLALHRRLLTDQPSIWHSQASNAIQQWPDDALLGVAEVSALAAWKSSAKEAGTLSMRELIRRGDVIEQHIQYHILADSASPADDPSFLARNIHREAALLYLHAVISDGSPAIPEIVTSVGTIISHLHHLPQNDTVDASLLFPLFLAACLTDDRPCQNYLSQRLIQSSTQSGNIDEIITVVESVWQQRELSPAGVNWREILSAYDLLLSACP